MKHSRLALTCVAVLVAGWGTGLKAEDNRLIADLHLKLIWINPGEFDMGTRSSGVDNQRPVTHVVLSRGFWLGQTEVTQAQWTAVMGDNPSYAKGDSLPVEKVDWDLALKFCKKLTQRERTAGRLSNDLAFTLPTEAQWEYACRAGRTAYDVGMVNRIYTDFTEINAMAWNKENSGGTTHPVGRKKPNAWGFFDMQGNVVEWCLSSFKYDYPGGTMTDPVYAPAGYADPNYTENNENLRFYRGGAFGGPPDTCTSTFRWWQFRYGFSPATGLRVALCPVH